MRVDTLYHRMATDVKQIHDAILPIFPVKMPARYETQTMNIRHFITKLNGVMEPFNVFNEIKDNLIQKEGTITTEGLWLSKSRLPENGSGADVRIIWNLHPKTKRFQMSPYHWKRRRFYFYELLMHELIHRHQPETERVYRTRSEDRDTKEEQEYYGQTSEIETYAHESALELKIWWPHLSRRDAIAEAYQFTNQQTPPTYVLFMHAFEECPKHPAVAHFKRKVKAFYATIEKHQDFYDSLQLSSLV